MKFESVEVADLESIRGVAVARGVSFRQIIVTGPPASGKSELLRKLGGWPEEGYLDLARKGWWRDRILTFRPREVHFGFPFIGFEESLAVFDKAWLDSPSAVDLGRIRIPPSKKGLFSVDWRQRYVFDFQLVSAETILQVSRNATWKVSHRIEPVFDLHKIELQLEAYRAVAAHFSKQGMRVYVRDRHGGPPRQIVDQDGARAARDHVTRT